MTTREYVGVGITVHWDSERCIHSERCTTGGPSVFNRAARPWVNVDGASADEIARVIDTCPSGALSYTRTDGKPDGPGGRAVGEDAGTSLVIISPQVNGPLVIEGPVGIRRPDGTVKVAPMLVLCRCGQSGSKPYCDGSHARVGFVAEGAP